MKRNEIVLQTSKMEVRRNEENFDLRTFFAGDHTGSPLHSKLIYRRKKI